MIVKAVAEQIPEILRGQRQADSTKGCIKFFTVPDIAVQKEEAPSRIHMAFRFDALKQSTGENINQFKGVMLMEFSSVGCFQKRLPIKFHIGIVRWCHHGKSFRRFRRRIIVHEYDLERTFCPQNAFLPRQMKVR